MSLETTAILCAWRGVASWIRLLSCVKVNSLISFAPSLEPSVGLLLDRQRVVESYGLPKFAGIFQVRILGSSRRLWQKPRNIGILTSSQATFKALYSMVTPFRLVEQCTDALNSLSGTFRVTLFWVLGRTGQAGLCSWQSLVGHSLCLAGA